MAAPLSRAEIAAAEVDPGLMLLALERIADFHVRRRRKGHMLRECAEAYFEFFDVDPPSSPDAVSPDDLLGIAALAARLGALAALIESGQIVAPPAAGAMSPDAMVAAASTARITFTDGEWRFQLLDFIARAGRA